MTRRPGGPTGRAAYFLRNWALPRQARGESHRTAARSEMARRMRPRLEDADAVGVSVCPYCAVGCSTLMYARDGRIIQVEGNPDSPINAGTLCPKGANLLGLHTAPNRLDRVKYRAPHATDWEEVPLDWAMDRIAHLTKKTRDETFVEALPDGTPVNHTLGIASLGGATLDNEENYLIKKVLRRRARHGLDREPGAGLPLELGARPRRVLRAGRGDDGAVGPCELGLRARSWARTWPRRTRSRSAS